MAKLFLQISKQIQDTIAGHFPRLSIDYNPFSKRRKRPGAAKYIPYLKDVLKGEGFEIGEYSYCSGLPKVFRHPRRKLKRR